MKKYLITILLTILALNVFSQSFKVSFSDEFKIVEKFNRDKVFKSAIFLNNYIYSAVNPHVGGNGKWLFTRLFDATYSLQVLKYDKNMNLIKQVDLENGAKSFAPKDPVLIDFSGTLLLAYYKTSNKSSFDLFLSVVNPETLTLSNTVKIMSTPVENVNISKMEKELDNIRINFELSPDNTKLLLTGMVKENTIATFVLDKHLQIINQSITPLPGSSKYYLTSGVISDNNFICLALTSEQNENLLLSINSDGNKIQSKIQPLKDGLFTHDLKCKLSNDQTTVYAYTTVSPSKDYSSYAKGILVASLPITLNTQMIIPKVYGFTQELNIALLQKGGGGMLKRENVVYNFVPQLLELEDGNIILTGSPEFHKVETIEKMSSLKPMSLMESFGERETIRSTYETGSIISLFLKKESSEYTYSLLPRDIYALRAHSQTNAVTTISFIQEPRISRGYFGYFVKELKNKIVFVYDDAEKNIEQDLNGKTISAKTSANLALAEAAIDKDGKILYRKKLADNQDGRYTYNLSETIYGSNNFYIIPISKQGNGGNELRDFYNHLCILELQ